MQYEDPSQGLLQLQAWVSTKWSPIETFFFFTNFNISSVFGIKGTLLPYNADYNPSGLHSQTPRPGAVEGLAQAPQNQLTAERKESIKKERENSFSQQKTLTLLLKPASPTPSNTGSSNSFQRYGEMNTEKILHL